MSQAQVDSSPTTATTITTTMPTINTSSSQPSSPRSSHGLPSPPDSPYSDSSFPSVSSSFFFSSAAVSPPHSGVDDDNHSSSGASGRQGSGPGLIIPSLTLPDAVRRPTVYGKTMGELRMLVVDGGCNASSSHGGSTWRRGGASSLKTSRLARMLLEDNEEVIETGDGWEDVEPSVLRVLRASSDLVDNYEPTRNIHIFEVDDLLYEDPTKLCSTLKSIIQSPFHPLLHLVGSNSLTTSAVPTLANLISAPTTPLYTVLILLVQNSPTPLENLLIDSLSSLIPIVCISSSSFSLTSLSSPSSSVSSPSSRSTTKLSYFHPLTPLALRHGLFRSPETLARLRGEAADKFLRWCRVEGVAKNIMESRRMRSATVTKDATITAAWKKSGWEKEWESRWEEELSRDVAGRLKEMETQEQEPLSSSSDEDDDRANAVGVGAGEEAKEGAEQEQEEQEEVGAETIHQAQERASSPAPSSVLPGSEPELPNQNENDEKKGELEKTALLKANAPPAPVLVRSPDTVRPFLAPKVERKRKRRKTRSSSSSYLFTHSRHRSSSSQPHSHTHGPLPLPLFDPLHIPSLIMFSLSLVRNAVRRHLSLGVGVGVGVGFCVGVGLGVVLSQRMGGGSVEE